MDSAVIPIKRFHAKRPGGLVGTITEVSEYLRLLYSMIAGIRDNRRSWTLQDFLETAPGGACPACSGTGTVIDIDHRRLIMPELSLKHGAVLIWAGTVCGPVSMIKQLARMIGIDYEKPLAGQDPRFIDILLYGYDKEPVTYTHKNKQHTEYYRGCYFTIRGPRGIVTTSKGNLRAIDYFAGPVQCPECHGSKLTPESLAVTIQAKSFVEASGLSVPELLRFIQGLSASLEKQEWQISAPVIEEIELRLIYLNKIGMRDLRCHNRGISYVFGTP